MHNSSRIIKNTGILYLKMLVTMVIALFSTRLVLNALGSEDFGLYTLVAGVIGMLSFLNKSMGSATQRYLSYNKNKGVEESSKVFNTAMVLHFIIGIVFVVILELAGLFLFNGFLNINPDRIFIAKFIFHCMVASTFLSIITVPYDALINTHEDMFVFALFNVLESCFKLGIAIYLYYSPWDRLGTYGVLLTGMLLLSRTIRRLYSYFHYPEAKLNCKNIDKKLMKEMTSFTSWNLIDPVSYIAKGQGLPLLLNLFFGTSVNAAYGLSLTVRQNVIFFADMLFKSSNPQVMGNVGSGNLPKAIQLSVSVCKLSYLLFAFFSMPLIAEMPFVLKIWLGNPPDHTILFCRLTLVTVMVIMIARGLHFLIMGVGNIRNYEFGIGIANLIVFPIAYLMLKTGHSPESIFWGITLSDLLVVIWRILVTKKKTNFDLVLYLKEIPCKLLPVSISIFLLLYVFSKINCHEIIHLLGSIFISSFLIILSSWFYLFNNQEKKLVKEILKKIKNKIKT